MKSLKPKIKMLKRSEFEALLDNTMLSSEEKEFARLYYIEDKDINYIADMYGYEASTIMKKHKRFKEIIASML